MERQRTPQARSRIRPQLGDSWVVESDGDDEHDSPATSVTLAPSSATSRQADDLRHSQRLLETPKTPRRRSSRTAAIANSEPDLIMPSIHEANLDGSWLEEKRNEREPTRTGKRQSRLTHAKESKPRNAMAHDKFATTSETIEHCIKPILGWCYDVLGGALHKLKTPISYLIVVYLFVGLLIVLRNVVTSSVYSALSPICHIPGSSFLNLPMCHSNLPSQYNGDQPPPVQFDELMTVQSKFEAILEESAGGASLPLDMKRGETSIRDLRQVVRYSQLHSKNELVLEFDGFIDTARIASLDLQKFNSHVGRGVDNILATARWTKRVLDGIALNDGSRGAISSFVNDRLLAPFQPLKFTEDALLDQYIQHTHIVEEEIQRLIAEAQVLLLVLQNLEDRLDVIHGVAVRDNLHAQGSRAEVLSQLWTMVGGNRHKLGKFDSQLRLLGQVNTYRHNAIAHVSGTMVKLQGMGAELEELRERVGGVELLGGKMGIPLSVHIENIELGVERLEQGRLRAKAVENEELRRTIERGNGAQRMIGRLD